MFDLLKDVYQRIESIRGKNLVVTISIIFVAFTVIGLLLGYSMQAGLIEDELDSPDRNSSSANTPQKKTFEGRIEYVNPNLYGGVTHVLVDENGKDVLLLVADDEKLAIAEGLFVKVAGYIKSKASNSDHDLETLLVEEVIISNASD